MSEYTTQTVPEKQEYDTQSIEIDLQTLFIDIYKGARKLWWVVLILGLLSSGLNYYWERESYSPMYLASATFTVATQTSSNYGTADYSFSYDGSVEKMTDTFPYILKSDILQQIIMEDLGVTYLNGSINAKGVEYTNLFTIEVSGPKAEDAYQILLSAIKNYAKVAEFIIGDTKMNILSEPFVSNQPINSVSYKRTLAKGFLAGAFVGVLIIIAYAFFRRTIRKVDEIETDLNQKSLGTIPNVRFKRCSNAQQQRLVILNHDVGSSFQEAIRALRTRILKFMDSEKLKVLLVTSTMPNEGKSTTALNLAISIAQKGSRVLLIDADMKRQPIQGLLNIKGRPTTFVDTMGINVSHQIAVLKTQTKGLFFLSCGLDPANSVKILSSPNFEYAISELKKEMDYIIVDSPPCGLMADASVLAGLCDGMLYVISQDTVKVPKIIEGIQSMGYSGIKTAGCVLNNVKFGIQGYGYGYGYSSHYYGAGHSYGGYGAKVNQTGA